MNSATNTQAQATKTGQLSKIVPKYGALPETQPKRRAKKYDKNQEYHELIKRTGINDEQLSAAFGYKSAISWKGARRRKLNQSIVVNLWRIFAESITGKINQKSEG